MDLNRLNLFLNVAREGSISRASAKVFLSQPALSLQIQALESELNIQLFERHNRGLILTDEGKTLFERAKILVEWEEETLLALQDQAEPKGTLKIGTYTTISSYLLPGKLKPFFEAYPGIELNYDYCSVEDALIKLKARELDMIIMSEIPDLNDLIKIPLLKDKLVLVSSINNKKIPKKISPAELSQFPFLTYPHKFDYCYREIDKKLGKHLSKAPRPIVSESFDTLKQSLLHDLGISFMPHYLITKELEEKKLKQIELSGINLPIQFFLVLRPEYTRSARIRVLKEFLCQNLSATV